MFAWRQDFSFDTVFFTFGAVSGRRVPGHGRVLMTHMAAGDVNQGYGWALRGPPDLCERTWTFWVEDSDGNGLSLSHLRLT